MDLFQSPPPLPFSLPPDDPRCAVQWRPEPRAYRVTVPDGELLFIEHFLDATVANRARDFLRAVDGQDPRTLSWAALAPADINALPFTNIRWKQDSIRMYGKQLPLPRLTAWYADAGHGYRYSGIDNPALPWNDGLLWLKRHVEQAAQARFNSVMLNWYRGGEDWLGWHADDEPELGTNPVIASLSLGATRDFQLRHNDDKALKLNFPLDHGSLLVMRGALQHHWQHAVPKRKRVANARFNLTFRWIHNGA
ncbi:MAG: alpha-ketoglutarate-dependent dioxygenase AlkB [Nevskiaceae bacterium]|nr:MAG: alpha-ketoglutarate-dependent dioxygenase AlkB [Nevskiaceae bacterium]TBR71434.1 MAG: alpha-ketoglutarate-dependent dioxygenase AlkB [Nevskiaceae bacterium]